MCNNVLCKLQFFCNKEKKHVLFRREKSSYYKVAGVITVVSAKLNHLLSVDNVVRLYPMCLKARSNTVLHGI